MALTTLTHKARFDAGPALAMLWSTWRRRWASLIVITLGVGLAPRLAVSLIVKDTYQVGSHDLGMFAMHAAGELGQAFLGHFTDTLVMCLALGVQSRVGLFGVLRQALFAVPVLLAAWVVMETDTLVRLANDWTQFVVEPASDNGKALFDLAFLTVDVALTAAGVAAVGVFTPVVLSERLGLLDALGRAWRLMRGARVKLTALTFALLAAEVLATIVLALVSFASHQDASTRATWGPWLEYGTLSLVGGGWGVIAAASYMQLRQLHDGALPDQIAETFA